MVGCWGGTVCPLRPSVVRPRLALETALVRAGMEAQTVEATAHETAA